MAGEDLSIKTRVEADVSNFEKGMNKVEKSLKGFSNKLADNINRLGKKGLVGSIANVTLAMQGLTQSFNTVIKFAKNVSKAINECTEAYKGQVIAERALDTAIANNPFISGASSKALKEFASEMQKVSNYGDEELIPMMTNLVSLGRTESETMQIMSVAMDMSAGMGISLDSAITQLNATLNGNIGRLGQQNAELKGLTEEELKQGKAIEILGEKFKGLSSATADTSKQLQNIKGDFKEALGQFTLPSSDMWNKFWAGFYEKGIAIIQKFNDYLDVKIIGKQLVENLYNNARTVAKANKLKVEDVFMDFRYVREELSYLNDSELATLQKTLERQKERTQGEERILATVKQMLRNKELEADQERANAEAEAKKAREEEARLAREKELAELRKKQAEEREKQLKVENQWQDKILDQQISMLEKEKESAVAGAEERGEATYQIEREYNEKLLELKLQKLERERESELNAENVTADAKIAINQYYDNEVKKVYDELGQYKKKKKEEEKKEEKKTLAKMLGYAKQYAEKIKQIFSKVLSSIKSVFSGGVSIFKKLFEINPDEILNNILKVEDSILTFFVETLPKLPNLVASIMQSIAVLTGNVRNVLRSSDVRNIILSILNSISSNLPQIVKDVLAVMKEIVSGLVEGLSKWVKSGGWKILLDLMLEIQKTLEEIVIDNIDEIAEIIADMMPDLVNMLVKSIVSASKTLGKIIKPILKIVGTLIDAVLKVITSQEVINASIDAIGKIVEALVSFIIGNLVPILTRIINAIVKATPDLMPKLIDAIINGFVSGFGEGLVNFFKNMDWGEVFSGMVSSLGDIAKKFASMLSGGLPNISSGFGGGSSSGGNSFVNVAKKVVDPLGLFWHANGTNNASAGLSIVGEAGPELVRFRGGEQVLNNRNTNKALAEMGGNTNNFNVTFNNLKDTSAFTMMQQLKAYNRQMAINGVI